MSNTVVNTFVKLWADGDAHGMVALCRPDAVIDINVPQWRYQLHPEALLEAWLKNAEMPNRRVAVGYQEPTPDGGVVEFEVRGTFQGAEVLIRELWTVRTDGEKVTECVMYCTGGWDADTVARQQAEAPMMTDWFDRSERR